MQAARHVLALTVARRPRAVFMHSLLLQFHTQRCSSSSSRKPLQNPFEIDLSVLEARQTNLDHLHDADMQDDICQLHQGRFLKMSKLFGEEIVENMGDSSGIKCTAKLLKPDELITEA
ncbi:hypothetical protein CCR75_003711 [Bremia lactucae]|uniref:Uncharacterized protein n=1 Tax=Bremia lactucae TaxID=4779 RepID=A0A976IKT7_BRELC|nr:hypothetical protein CCR75_003711 [Bremia lactucae]